MQLCRNRTMLLTPQTEPALLYHPTNDPRYSQGGFGAAALQAPTQSYKNQASRAHTRAPTQGWLHLPYHLVLHTPWAQLPSSAINDQQNAKVATQENSAIVLTSALPIHNVDRLNNAVRRNVSTSFWFCGFAIVYTCTQQAFIIKLMLNIEHSALLSKLGIFTSWMMACPAQHIRNLTKREPQRKEQMYAAFFRCWRKRSHSFSYALYLFRYEHFVDNQTHSGTHSAQWGLFSSAVWVHKCCHWNMSTALWIAMDSANLSLAAAALAVGCFQVWQQHDLFDLHRAAGWLQTSSPLARIRMRRVSCIFSLFRRNLEAVDHYRLHFIICRTRLIIVSNFKHISIQHTGVLF